MQKLQPWTLQRIEQLIIGQIEESLFLEYKAMGAISAVEKQRTAISIDVSSFANSAGGTIIYGIAEDAVNRHLPGYIDPITDFKRYTKEWLEDVIDTNIFPPVRGIRITPIRISGENPGSIYVVDIPQSHTAHQASDFRYHKRMNFKNVPMHDYEITDVKNRKTSPKIELKLASVARFEEMKPKSERKTYYSLKIDAINKGGVLAKYLNVNMLVSKNFTDPKNLLISESTTKNGESYYKFKFHNGKQDLVGYVPGPMLSSPHYGPLRYQPILPGMEVNLGEFTCLNPETLKGQEVHIYATMHVDNEQPQELHYVLRNSDFHIVE